MSDKLKTSNFKELIPFLEQEKFAAVGAVDFELALGEYQIHVKLYEEWLRNEFHGDMNYLSRGLEFRKNPSLLFPKLKSVIAVAFPYNPHPIGNEKLRYARYLNSPDYHFVMKEKLTRSFQNYFQVSNRSFDFKICVDTSAVLERAWAQICGLGWIGKNNLLINPQLGSYLFLGIVFTDQSFGLAPSLLKNYCGECSRCIDACPTKALKEHELNSNLCISYLTLEKRGEIKHDFDPKGFLAGCDICQEVCPFNSKATKYTTHVQTHDSLISDETRLNIETESEYKLRIKNSALSRIKYNDFKRNLRNVVRK